MKIRRQVYELTKQDLSTHPVWEFALDEEGEPDQDETTVRPWGGTSPLNPKEGMFVVRARFTLADGSAHEGYLTPAIQGDTSAAAVQPVIVTDGGHVVFWHGVLAPTSEEIADSYRKLGRHREHVFPIRYEADVPIRDGVVFGTLSGFMHFRSFRDQSVVTLT